MAGVKDTAADPYNRKSQTFPQLSEDHIKKLKNFGEVVTMSDGDMLFERGQRRVDFFVILSGVCEIFDQLGNSLTEHKERQFTGEIDLLNDRDILVSGRMKEGGEVLRIERDSFRNALDANPQLSEILVRAFILRRIGLIEHEEGGVIVFGESENRDSLRVRRFLERNGYPFTFRDATDKENETCLLDKFGADGYKTPVVISTKDKVLQNPSDSELARELGIETEIDTSEVFDVAVIGAGPAGLAAGVYAASEGLKVILLEKGTPGGQAATSSKIENYLGFPTGISGGALAGRAQIQAQKFGARIAVTRNVEKLVCDEKLKKIYLSEDQCIECKSVVLASGAHYRRLGVDNEDRFENAGIHYAATNMEANLCRNQEVVVVGGGNSAGQAAIYLSAHASKVHLLLRGEGLGRKMSQYLVKRIDAVDNIVLHENTEISELRGDEHLEGVTFYNSKKDEHKKCDVRNVFLMIGATPNTDYIKDCVDLDKKGFVLTGIKAVDRTDKEAFQPSLLQTSEPGVFAVGDVRSDSVKRVASAVGEGSICVQFIHRYLDSIQVKEEAPNHG